MLSTKPEAEKVAEEKTDTESKDATAEAAAPADAEAAPEEAEPELSLEEQQKVQIEELIAEKADLETRWKRALADSENTRQMAKREIATSKKFAVQGFAKSMLDVCDNLKLALEHTPTDQLEAGANPSLSALFEGVEMTEKILLQQLGKHGVTQFSPIDEVFDPNVMMALYEMPDPDKEPMTVIQVVKTGFMLNERVLRPADVGVVKKP